MQAETLPFMGHARDRNTGQRGPGKGRLHLVLPATKMDVRRALTRARNTFASMGLTRDAIDLAELVLAEVMNNIVEHAYSDLGHGIIELEAGLHGPKLRVQLMDDGVPMPGDQLPRAKRPALDVPRGSLPEGGFGWALIHDLTCELDYTRDGARNILRFTLDLAELDQAP